MASVDDILEQLYSNMSDEYQYMIDNDLRVITVPSEGVILGVINDKDVNTVSFHMSRYYKKLDLSEFSIRIYYQNANAVYGYFEVTEKEISEDSIDFNWLIGDQVVKYQGTVRFAVALNIFNSDTVVKSFNTTIGEATVLSGMNPTNAVTESQVEDLLEHIKAESIAMANKAASDAVTALTSETTEIVTKANKAVTDCAGAAEEARNAANTIANKSYPHKLSSGRYDNASLLDFCQSHTNDKMYGIIIPKSDTVECIKFGAHADYPAPTPSTNAQKGSDPYENEDGPFWFIEANGGNIADGSPYITDFEDEDGFSRSHPDEDTVIFRNVIWYKFTETDANYMLAIRSQWAPGYVPEEAALIAENTIRPYIIQAKYPLSKDSQGRYRSTSGLAPAIRTISHNSLITQLDMKNSAAGAKTTADEWYIKTMFLMKYGTKHSQKYYSGCTGYTMQCNPTVDEDNTNRIIVSKSNASSFLVGSYVMFGTRTGASSNDRYYSQNYDIFDCKKITKIEEYDSSNSAIYIDVDTNFSSKTTCLLSTSPWMCGCCDDVDGDGSPFSALNGKDPFVIQGIEMMHGMTEILGNVIVSNTDGTGWRIFVNFDCRNESTSVTDNYVELGLIYSGTESWQYPKSTKMIKGFFVPTNEFGSSSKGMNDGMYLNANTTQGTREWQSFGGLGSGSYGGLWYVDCDGGLGGPWWDIGSRRSYTAVMAGVN